MAVTQSACEQWSNTASPVLEPLCLIAIDESRAPEIWPWKVQQSCTTLLLAMCQGDVRKHPDFVAQNGFWTEIPRFYPYFFGPIQYAREKLKLGARSYNAQALRLIKFGLDRSRYRKELPKRTVTQPIQEKKNSEIKTGLGF